MAQLKKGLGRGLDALLDPFAADVLEENKKVIQADIHKIDTNIQQPRKSFDEEGLKELADSIRMHGIVQPLILVKSGDRYTIVAGERRFRAARLAGLKEVPAIVTDYDESEMHEVALIENIQREDLNPIEEAAAIRFLMEQHDMTQEEVAKRIGRSRPAVANSLRLLQLPKDTMEYIREGKLSAGHGRALAGIDDRKLQETITGETIRLGYSVRALESRIRNLEEKRSKQKKTKSKTGKDPVLTDTERMIREKLGTKVKIEGNREKGRITISYFSAEELNAIFDRIVGDAE